MLKLFALSSFGMTRRDLMSAPDCVRLESPECIFEAPNFANITSSPNR